MQRALAAKSISHAQSGLMIGGLIKYLMAVIIVIPGIALYGILKKSNFCILMNCIMQHSFRFVRFCLRTSSQGQFA